VNWLYLAFGIVIGGGVMFCIWQAKMAKVDDEMLRLQFKIEDLGGEWRK
jgi:hypothetical protein